MKRALLAAALGGCISLSPTYERPIAPVPKQLPGGQGSANAAAMPIAEFVHEDKLRQILTKVLGANRTLRRSALDIESARQLYRVQRAAELPSIDLSAQVTSTRSLIGTTDNATARFTDYTVGVGIASWEVDLFGRIKSLSDAKLQSYLASVELAKATRISLIAEASTAYVTMSADRSRLAIAKDTMESSKKAMDLTEALVGGGTSEIRSTTRSCRTSCRRSRSGSRRSPSVSIRPCCSTAPTSSRPSTT